MYMLYTGVGYHHCCPLCSGHSHVPSPITFGTKNARPIKNKSPTFCYNIDLLTELLYNLPKVLIGTF